MLLVLACFPQTIYGYCLRNYSSVTFNIPFPQDQKFDDLISNEWLNQVCRGLQYCF